MRTIEEYWAAFEEYGFTKRPIPCGYQYDISPALGEGGFRILGELDSYVISMTDLLFYKPLVFFESTQEKYLEFGQLYAGGVTYYKEKKHLFPVEHGLNYLVCPPRISGYKRMDAGERLVSVGITYRESFLQAQSDILPSDFSETAAAVLNPEALVIPSITFICDQLRGCQLNGTALSLFLKGKAYEAFGITLDYVYAHRQTPPVTLSAADRRHLDAAREILQEHLCDPPKLKELAHSLGMNQQKLMTGFKYLNGVTVHGYLRKLRMEKAAKLLCDTDLPVAAVARSVGYHGDGHFQQAFKAVYGTTPARLRGELRLNRY